MPFGGYGRVRASAWPLVPSSTMALAPIRFTPIRATGHVSAHDHGFNRLAGRGTLRSKRVPAAPARARLWRGCKRRRRRGSCRPALVRVEEEMTRKACVSRLFVISKRGRARLLGFVRAAARAEAEEFGGAPPSSGVGEQGPTPVEHVQDQGEHDQDQACDHLQLGRGCGFGQTDRVRCGRCRSPCREPAVCIGGRSRNCGCLAAAARRTPSRNPSRPAG